VFAWNDLGMHCMDSDYSIFSILPPFNVLHAQAMDGNGHLVKDNLAANLTYEAVADPSGSINKSSIGKTNFWSYTLAFFGVQLTPDNGVAGFAMPGPSNIPQTMAFRSDRNMFEGLGIPITPHDDAGNVNYYPMMKVAARDSTNRALSNTVNVLPVSDEMDCRACHGSNMVAAAMPPVTGWANDPDPDKDYRQNVVMLHDQKVSDPVAYQNALNAAGYPNGLWASAQAGTPILCARCHLSNALAPYGIKGLAGIEPLTTAVHGLHAKVTDPVTNMTLGSSGDRSACYRCHPGSTTKCLRGAMGSAVDANGNMLMQCQNCHGHMAVVGDPSRQGWLDEPTCQNCHTGDVVTNSGQLLYTDVYDPNTGNRRIAASDIFATNPNVPVAGSSLFRYSSGHGGLQCEACHGATHAEYPSSEINDNLQSLTLQGHTGPLADCNACHTTLASLAGPFGGPHGMHVIGQQWVSSHGDFANSNGSSSCRSCHGTDYRGTYISRALGDRTFNTEGGSVSFSKGTQIGCYSCHNGPNGGGSARRAKVVRAAK